jgi:hypothetical protein
VNDSSKKWVCQVVTAFKNAEGKYLPVNSVDSSAKAETTLRWICQSHLKEGPLKKQDGVNGPIMYFSYTKE